MVMAAAAKVSPGVRREPPGPAPMRSAESPRRASISLCPRLARLRASERAARPLPTNPSVNPEAAGFPVTSPGPPSRDPVSTRSLRSDLATVLRPGLSIQAVPKLLLRVHLCQLDASLSPALVLLGRGGLYAG